MRSHTHAIKCGNMIESCLPRPPTPPPTHPTHPPRITHPPEHFNIHSTVNPVDAFFDGDGQDVKLGPGNPFHGSNGGGHHGHHGHHGHSGEIDSFASLAPPPSSSRPPPRPRHHHRPHHPHPPPHHKQHHFHSEDSRSSFRPPHGHSEDEGHSGFQVPRSRPGSFDDPFKGFQVKIHQSS